MEFLETQLLITEKVSKLLEKRLNHQKQYLTQPYLVADSMMEPDEENDHNSDSKKILPTFSKESGIWKDVIKENIDKTHLLGKPDAEGRQLKIAKFTSDNFKNYLQTTQKPH